MVPRAQRHRDHAILYHLMGKNKINKKLFFKEMKLIILFANSSIVGASTRLDIRLLLPAVLLDCAYNCAQWCHVDRQQKQKKETSLHLSRRGVEHVIVQSFPFNADYESRGHTHMWSGNMRRRKWLIIKIKIPFYCLNITKFNDDIFSGSTFVSLIFYEIIWF